MKSYLNGEVEQGPYLTVGEILRGPIMQVNRLHNVMALWYCLYDIVVNSPRVDYEPKVSFNRNVLEQ
jgi:hypothetical protein